jgi:hypothetical protein
MISGDQRDVLNALWTSGLSFYPSTQFWLDPSKGGKNRAEITNFIHLLLKLNCEFTNNQSINQSIKMKE